MVDQIKVQMVPLWIEHDTLIIFLLGAVTCNHDCSSFNAVLNKERITSITSWFNFLNFNVTQRRLASSIKFIHKKAKNSFLILNEVRTGNIFFKIFFWGGDFIDFLNRSFHGHKRSRTIVCSYHFHDQEFIRRFNFK